VHWVYKTQHVAGVGAALIIICDGEQDRVRFAEYHIILRHTGCNRISMRLLIDAPRNVVTDDDLRDQALNFASAYLQSQTDERVRSSYQVAPVVAVTGADDSEIRKLRYAGVCTHELEDIARITLSIELKELIRMLWSLPVISVQEL
jgi:hypothetical protein